MPEAIDALLIHSFGGPEGPEDVMPFLRGVVAGKGVPDARLADVAKHYDAFGGCSPIGAANRRLVADVQAELVRRGLPQRVYLGNRHWHPFLRDTVATMASEGVRRAAVFVTSACGSHPSCRAYLDELAAVADLGVAFDKLRLFFHHPAFLAAVVDRARQAMVGLDSPRLVFTAHSIPTSMAATSPYEAQLREACQLVAGDLDVGAFDLVWQSRSGPPHVPWLEPDVLGFLADVPTDRPIVLVPIGFVSDHMEVVWDLDREAADLAAQRGLQLVRPKTPQDHPAFAAMVVDLLLERIDPERPRPARGTTPAWPDRCAEGCCAPPRRAQGRPRPGQTRPPTPSDLV